MAEIDDIASMGSAESAKVKQEFSDQEDAKAGVRCIQSVSKQIKTLDDALAAATVDLTVWEVEKHVVNSWGVTGKMHAGQDASGNWKPQDLWENTNWQVKVWLRRRVPKPVEDVAAELAKCIKPAPRPKSLTKKRPITKDSVLAVAGLMDVHLGKLCWAPETGKGHYDLKIAEERYKWAVDQMAYAIRERGDVAQVEIPLGQDFLHVDDDEGRTTGGTYVYPDGRYAKILEVGHECFRYGVSRFTEVCDRVRVRYHRSNHDQRAALHMTHWVDAYFRNEPRVKVDTSPAARKYVRWGNALLGFVHADKVRIADLPGIMSDEAAKDWGETTYRVFFTGHTHKNKKQFRETTSPYHGVSVEELPALCSTDAFLAQFGKHGHAPHTTLHFFDRTNGWAGTLPFWPEDNHE